MMQTLTDDVQLVSPISGRMVVRGKRDVVKVLEAVHSVLREIRWSDDFGDASRRVALGRATVGGVALGGAMVFELDADGRIRVIRPHMRPWLALSVFALRLAPRVARHPGVVRRGLGR